MVAVKFDRRRQLPGETFDSSVTDRSETFGPGSGRNGDCEINSEPHSLQIAG